MTLPLFNESLDDTPDNAAAEGFTGYDSTADPARLAADIVRAGENMWADVDLLIQTRPALKFNTLLTRTTLGAGSHIPRGMGYYDVPTREAMLVSADGKLLEITDDGDDVTSNVLSATPVAQVETATAVGTITLDGNATVVVTAALVTGSPLAVNVAVLNTDTASTWAGKVRAALTATAAITAHYTVGGAGATITLTAIVKAANDATLNISLDNGTCTGITTAATSANTTAGVAPAAAMAPAYFAQLVDRMFWSDGTLNWSLYSGGWSHGTVTAFSSGAAMPAWGAICSHGLRLLAVDPATGKIYASAIGTAYLAANWTATDNFRVTAEGDMPQALISGQGGNLIVICERSAWMVNTSAASVADWTVIRITNLAGTAAPKTAVQVGQDVIFLSDLKIGVLSLGALANTDSISPQTALSAPMQRFVKRVNPAALSTAWASMWGNLYLLAVPLDEATVPSHILPFNTLTRRWGTPWTATLPSLTVDATEMTFAGFVCGGVSNFGGSAQTLICDNTGRALRWDADYEKDQSAAATDQEIVSWMTTKAFTHERPDHYKQPMLCGIEWYNSTGQEVQINLVRDGRQAYPDEALADCEIIAEGLSTSSVSFFPIHFPLEFLANESYDRTFNVRGFGRYRKASVQIVSAKRRMKVRAVRLASFLDAPPLS